MICSALVPLSCGEFPCVLAQVRGGYRTYRRASGTGLIVKLKTPPVGLWSGAVGSDAERLTEHGVTETPWSFLISRARSG